MAFAVASNAKFSEIGYEGFETTNATQSGGTTILGETNIAYAEQGPCLATANGACVARETLAAVTSTLAHTGKKSLRLTKDATFDQPWLKLAKGTQYLVSGWISLGTAGSQAADVPSYAKGPTAPNPLGIRVHHRVPGAAKQMLATLEPAGPS